MLLNKWCVVFGFSALLVGSYALAQTDVRLPTESSAEKTMQGVMMDNQMITMVGNSLVDDDRLAMMVGHEVMVQKMLQNKEFMKKVQEGLKVNTNPDKQEEEVKKFSQVLSQMMSDQATVKRVMKDVMIRQIAKKQMNMTEASNTP